MKNDRKLILGITTVSHMSVHSLMLIFPTIMLVLTYEFSTGLAMLGVIASLSTFMFGLGALPTGILEKKMGCSSLLMLYQFGTVISSLIIASSQNLFILTVGLILTGLFSSIYHPVGLTIISRNIEKISKGMAIHGMGGSFGLALGPLIAAVCTDTFSWRFAYITISILNFILLIITFIYSKRWNIQTNQNIETEIPINQTNKSALKYYFAVSVLMGFAFTGFTTYLPTHFAVETRTIFSSFSDTMRGGIFTTLVLLCGIFGQSMGGWAGEKYSLSKYLFLIVLFNIPFFVLLGLVSGYWLIGTALLLGIIHFNWQPVGNSFIAKYTHSTQRGLGYGINFFLNISIGSFAAAVGGFIAEKYSVIYVFPVMGVVLIPALIFSWILIGKVDGN